MTKKDPEETTQTAVAEPTEREAEEQTPAAEEVEASEAEEAAAEGSAPEEDEEEEARAEVQRRYEASQAARGRIAERRRLEELQSRYEELSSKPPAPAAAGDDPEPDAEADPRAWHRWSVRQAVREELSPLREAQERAAAAQARQAEVAQTAAAVRANVEAMEREYEAAVPGYRRRYEAFVERRLAELTPSLGPQGATQAMTQELAFQMSRARQTGEQPIALVDRYIASQIGSSNGSTAAAEREVAETRKALGSPSAGSIATSPRTSKRRVTGAALLKAGKVNREDMVAAARDRIPEFGSFDSALRAIMREAHEASGS